VVLAERDGARWATRCTALQGPPTGGAKRNVMGLYADDPAAYAALWRMLLNVDLVSTTDVRSIATDDPLLAMLESARYANPTVRDASTSASSTSTAPSRHARPASAPDSAADLTVDVRELGSIYLGGVTLRALATAGQVVEHTSGAVRAVSTAFASDLQPWLSLGF
jgi:predicted acetyltransferase